MFTPRERGEVPTLGWDVADWIETYLAQPDAEEVQPFVLYPEQETFVVKFYEVRPDTCKRRRRRGAISRPRGWGKSPFVGAVAWCEALGAVRPNGWDDDGQLRSKPWAKFRTPLIQVAAVSEDQTKNTWTAMQEMGQLGSVCTAYPGTLIMDGAITLPRGRIECITASYRSAKGNRGVFCVMDQTEEWIATNGGIRLAGVLRSNAAKLGGSTLESPNAYIPGEDSVAEGSASTYKAILEGRTKDDGVYFDHREAPADTDLDDRDSLLAGLAYAYGDSAEANGGHVDTEHLVGVVWDLDTDPQVARSDYLNQITHASDAWISQPEWLRCKKDDYKIPWRSPVVLGFDGSRKRGRGVTDATALIGCEVSTGYVFEIHVWEQPFGRRDWEVPAVEVDSQVDQAFRDYNVIGFYADPAKWESYLANWEARYGKHLKVRSSQQHPIEWWMTGGVRVRTVRALEQFHTAVVDHELTHDGAAVLTRHVLNARRRTTTAGIQIAKEHPDSSRKIDACVAAVLAWECRLDALGRGFGKRGVPRRVR